MRTGRKFQAFVRARAGLSRNSVTVFIMARQSGIWQRKRDGWWMTTLNGNQVKLSTDKKEAQKAFHALMAGPIEEAEPAAASARPSFKKIANQYLGYTDKTQAANTFKSRRIYLQLFCDTVKGAKAEDVRPHTLEEWIASHKAWSLSTATTVRGIVLGCYTWAEAQGYITRNPFRKVKAGKHTRRERILTADEKALVHGRASPPLRDFILMLDQTGCRPFSEAASMTAAMVDFEAGHRDVRKAQEREEGEDAGRLPACRGERTAGPAGEETPGRPAAADQVRQAVACLRGGRLDAADREGDRGEAADALRVAPHLHHVGAR